MVGGRGSKKNVDIETLLHWAYLDELPKRQTSSAEGIWDRLAQNGSLGGINPDPGHGSAQRYAHFGLPHPDAETIEKAVGRLESVVIDWKRNFRAIAGDLAALITVNDFTSSHQRHLRAKDGSGFGKHQIDRVARQPSQDGRGARYRVDEPRDVILVNTINISALVTMYAVRKSQPDWRTEQMRPVRTVAERGAQDLIKVIGKNRGRNHYSTGSYCPLIWQPSPIEVALARADYVAWHQGLERLSETLELSEHVALPPSAPPTPWRDGEKAKVKRRVFKQPHGPTNVLPLKPQRGRAGAPGKKPKNSKGRSLLFDREPIP